MLLMVLALFGCTPKVTKYYEQMNLLENPIRYQDAYFTHEFRMNEIETLYYMPDYFKIGDNIYTNISEKYVVGTKGKDWLGHPDVTYKEVPEATLKKIFSEG